MIRIGLDNLPSFRRSVFAFGGFVNMLFDCLSFPYILARWFANWLAVVVFLCFVLSFWLLYVESCYKTIPHPMRNALQIPQVSPICTETDPPPSPPHHQSWNSQYLYIYAYIYIYIFFVFIFFLIYIYIYIPLYLYLYSHTSILPQSVLNWNDCKWYLTSFIKEPLLRKSRMQASFFVKCSRLGGLVDYWSTGSAPHRRCFQTPMGRRFCWLGGPWGTFGDARMVVLWALFKQNNVGQKAHLNQIYMEQWLVIFRNWNTLKKLPGSQDDWLHR